MQPCCWSTPGLPSRRRRVGTVRRLPMRPNAIGRRPCLKARSSPMAGLVEAAAADQEQPGLRGDGLFLMSDGNADTRDFPAASASSNVGGMGSHWACCCPRPSGTERIDCIPTGDLDRAFLQAERLLDVSAARFDTPVNGYVRDTLGSVFNPGRPTDLAVQSMPVAGSRSGDTPVLHGPAVILQDVFERPRTNATLLQNTRARRVLVEQGRAAGVELEDVDTGQAATIRARWVVVAADALRTPQLLFASGIRPPALGRHLNEHAMLATMVELTGTDLEPTRSTEGGYALSNGPFASAGDGITWIPFTGADFPCSVQILHINGTHASAVLERTHDGQTGHRRRGLRGQGRPMGGPSRIQRHRTGLGRSPQDVLPLSADGSGSRAGLPPRSQS